MREKVENELSWLVSEGTLESVDYAEWAAPIVAVVKSDRKSVRICGDFRMTVNPVSKLNRYPISKVEDLFATLEGGKTFTKIDFNQAYQQLKLDEESKKYVVINTHKGLYSVALWYLIGSRHLPESHGKSPSGHSLRHSVYR